MEKYATSCGTLVVEPTNSVHNLQRTTGIYGKLHTTGWQSLHNTLNPTLQLSITTHNRKAETDTKGSTIGLDASKGNRAPLYCPPARLEIPTNSKPRKLRSAKKNKKELASSGWLILFLKLACLLVCLPVPQYQYNKEGGEEREGRKFIKKY